MRRIMVEASLCDGCMKCVEACGKRRGGTLTEGIPFDKEKQAACFVRKSRTGDFIPLVCRHCILPACLTACMSGALSRSEESGHILYDLERCASCFMCVMNCPYGMPKPAGGTEKGVIRCDFCMDSCGIPDCVVACTKGAIYIGEVL